MGLSTELISEFVKITNDNGKQPDENTVFGTVSTVSEDGKSGTVKIDGSDEATPFTTTCTVAPEDRVRLTIRNHNAIVTGNTTDISASAAELAEALTKFVTVNEDIEEVKISVGKNSIAIDNMGTTVTGLATFKSNLESGNGETQIDGGCIKAGTLTLSGSISFSDLSDAATKQAEINTAKTNASNALNAANNASSSASNALTAVNGVTIKEGSQTYLDGEMIYSGSIYADAMHLGGALTVYRTLYGSTVGGYLGYDSGFNSASGIGIRDSSEVNQVVCTNAAARVSSGDPTSDRYYSQFVASSDYAYIEASTAIILEIDGTSFVALSDHGTYGSLRPHANAPTMHLGNASYRWGGVYATNGEIQTSDRNHKNSIEHLTDKYVTLFDNITPRRFKMNEGTSGRYHIGYIAQEVEEAMLKAGVDSLEFGGFVRDIDADGKEICMLRYGEFDGIRDLKIKQLESRINELERRLANLETKEVG